MGGNLVIPPKKVSVDLHLDKWYNSMSVKKLPTQPELTCYLEESYHGFFAANGNQGLFLAPSFSHH